MPPEQRNEHGAAEMVGVLMLIAIFVVAAGILGVMYFSKTPSEKPPAVNVIVTNESRLIKVYHGGGDPLPASDLQIYVNGVVQQFEGFGAGDMWSVGDTLDYTMSPSDPMPSKIDIVYTGAQWRGTTGYLLATVYFGNLTSTDQDQTYYTITSYADTGGSISPLGVVPVKSGNSQTFTITNGSGYILTDVLVDSSSIGPQTTYTFDSVSSDHTISAILIHGVVNAYINATAGTGGTISPSGILPVTSGSDKTFNIIPTSLDYQIANVVVNDTYQQGPVPSFTFTNVTSNQTIRATFVTNNSNGLIGYYYNGMTWSGPSVPEITYRIRFADDAETAKNGWPSEVPHWPIGYIGTDNLFSVLYTGQIKIDGDGTYMFYLSSDDGSNLTIDGAQVINNMGDHSWTTVQGSKSLTSGYHNISVYMYENGGEAGVYLEYSNSTMARQFVTQLYHFNPPVPDFNATPTSGNAPLTVQFTDSSLGATAWTWDFGDGSPVSNFQNASHTYTSIGSYNVTLIAANTFGSTTLTKNNYITVGSYLQGFSASYYHGQTWTDLAGMRTDPEIRYADAAGQLNGDPSDETNWPIPMTGTGWDNNFSVTWDGLLRVNTSDSYTFSLRSDDGSWLWIDDAPLPLINNGGDHSATTVTGSTALAPGYHHIVVKMYENQGQAVARLQYYTASDTTLRQVTDVWHVAVIYPPVAGFTGTPLSGNAPLMVAFADSSTNTPISWQWVFDDGDTTNATAQNPMHKYTTAGLYNISLTATNLGGSNTFTRIQYVNVSPALSVVSFTGSPASGGVPLAVSFTDASTNSPTAWSWNFGDGSSANATLQNPVHVYTVIGVYNLSLVVTNAGGINSSVRTGYIYANPTITASAGSGGTITPSGAVVVTYGANQSFTITPTAGYHITNVVVDGVPQGAITSYPFTFVTASHSISATFAINTYTITSSAGAGGTISPSGTVIVNYGTDQSFSITPGTGYALSALTVDGASQTLSLTYTFLNVTTNHTIVTGFTVIPTFTGISPGAGPVAGGTSVAITGTGFTGTTSVTFGGTAATTFTVNNANSITATAPAHSAGAVDVVIATPGGSATGTGAYTYAPVPTFSSISVTSGPTTGGTFVTIFGSGFTGATSVSFGGTPATPFTVNTDTSIGTTAPAHAAGTVHVTVTTPGGTTATSSADQFTYYTPITAIGAITGTPQVGSVLAAGALTPSGATATYQWQRALTSGGTYTAIPGATSTTYTPVAGDIGYFIEVVATGTGSYAGTVTSAPVGSIGGIPITSIGAIAGTPHVGTALTAGTLTPSGAAATYQWQRSATSGGTYTAISGATSTSYTPVAGDGGYYIKVVATGTGSYTGTVTSAYTGPVTIIPTLQTFNTVGGPFTSTVPQGAITVTYLVVAGGGGGGRNGGGGGAGGVQTGTLSIGSTTSYSVTVGAGGAGSSAANTRGANGGNSAFATYTATGGGGGGSNYNTYYTGANGGSGGGGTRGNLGGTGSQGFNGGNGASQGSNYFGGGGGGAGGPGSNAANPAAGAGGTGTASSISGASVTYSCGGGGGAPSGGGRSAGAAGCAGAGAGGLGVLGAPATNFGSGGGGSGTTGTNGGAGYQGIVLLSYS